MDPNDEKSMISMGVFHEGETDAQQRAGIRASAARLGPRMIQRHLDDQFAAFLRHQPFVIVAGTTASGQVWASTLAGAPGFARATATGHVLVEARFQAEDPLAAVLSSGQTTIGLLVIDPMTRGRIRINGVGHQTPRGLELDVTEVFGNCPKYIQRRLPIARVTVSSTPASNITRCLNAGQRRFVEAADTFFIASRHPTRGADASHRGGRPGFVQTGADGESLTFPDYQGNNMFQTLGNLSVDPRAGLLFIDWSTGRTVQISGRAAVIWDDPRIAAWPGALRLVDLHVSAVLDRATGSPLRWEFVAAHRLNPQPWRSPGNAQLGER
jgi:hypothetical protein